MSTTTSSPWVYGGLLVVLMAGCEGEPPGSPEPKPRGVPGEAPVKKALMGKNVFLETQGEQRRVLISAFVCLREGPLELLLTRAEKKEHEAILAADIDARDVHKALLAAGAEAGSPVRYQPKYLPATGTVVNVTVQYEDNGKRVRLPAQKWIRNQQTGKNLDSDWVFAGSRLIPNPFDPDKPHHYLANDGDVICVSNFEGALLDLPIASTKDNDELAFEVDTAKVPPKDTKVVVILEPVRGKKK